MPLYEYKCQRCNRRFEELYKVSEAPAILECMCGALADKAISLIANTAAKWGDSHGYYDRGLGAYVENSQHRERLMKAKGVVSMEDYGKNYAEDRLEKRQADYDQHEVDVANYKQYRALGQSKGEAMAEVYNADRILEN